MLGLKEFGQSRDILAHQILVKSLDCAREHSCLECRGRNQDSNTPIAVSFVTMRRKKAQREHHYIRVVITYTDGETSGHRIFKDETKAKEWAERQNRSVAVKKVRLERFVRDAYAATKVRVGPKQRAH